MALLAAWKIAGESGDHQEFQVPKNLISQIANTPPLKLPPPWK